MAVPRSRTYSPIVAGIYNSKGWDKRGKLVRDANTPYSTTGVFCSIDDVVKGRSSENSVSHLSRQWSDGYIRLPRAYASDGTSAEVVFNGTVGWAGIPADPTGSLDYTAAMNELLRDAVGSMPLGVNLVVNLAELASLKTLVPSLLAGVKSVVKNKLGRKSARELAGSHLAYEFGLAPLISDFASMFAIREKVANRIRQLEARNGRSTRLVKRVPASVLRVPISSTFSSYPGHTIMEKGEWIGTISGAVQATVNSFFVNDNSAQCKLWSSALGLSTPLQNIWELVPFSFVIDWFIPIGNTFQRVEDKLGQHSTVRSCQLSNFMYSEKIEARSNSVLKCTAAATYPAWVGVTGAATRWDFSKYVRVAGMPPTGYLTSPSGWSLKRTALSVSLIAQKVLK